ncbi:MAG: hypothetical protein Q7R52_05485 [archaeon]|nr:hypothetical protein [archaeon]
MKAELILSGLTALVVSLISWKINLYASIVAGNIALISLILGLVKK